MSAFSFTSMGGDEDDITIPMMTRKKREVMKDVKYEKVEKDEESDSSEESGEEDEEEEEDKVVLPYRKIGEYLINFLRKNPEKVKRKLVYEDEDTKLQYNIDILKFYNTLGDIPVKIKIGKRFFIFKQVNSMYCDYYAMNVFRALNEHWEKKGVKARIPVYDIFPLAMSVENEDKKREFVFGGFIEFIEGNSMMTITSQELLKLVLNTKKDKEKMLNNFINTLVGTTIGNFLCGLQDRHQYNVILTPDIQVCHIDLNSVFGEQMVFHERIGLISAPSLYFPGSCHGFLKNKEILKFHYFRKEIINAYNCLPPFESIRKCLGHELQMKWVHDRMYGFTASWLLENLLSPINLINKQIRDIFQKQMGLGPQTISLDENEVFHLVSKKIYRVSCNGLFQMENSENWGNVLPCYCRGNENEVFLISASSGFIYVYNTKEGSFRSISQWNWKATKGIIYHDGYLYLACEKFYKINVEDGFYKVISNRDWVQSINQGAGLDGKLYLFTKATPLMYVFDPKNCRVKRVEVKGLKKFPISKKVVASESHKCIYFLDPGLFCLPMEEGMEKITKVSDLEMKGVLGATTLREDLIIVIKGDLFLWDSDKDKLKKINLGDKWSSTTLAF